MAQLHRIIQRMESSSYRQSNGETVGVYIESISGNNGSLHSEPWLAHSQLQSLFQVFDLVAMIEPQDHPLMKMASILVALALDLWKPLQSSTTGALPTAQHFVDDEGGIRY